MAQKAGRIWQEYGALEYRECVGEDLDVKMGKSFPRQLRLERGETVFFSWIVYKSRAHRDEVNAKVMKDPRMSSMPKRMPFDVKRTLSGASRQWWTSHVRPLRARRAPPRAQSPAPSSRRKRRGAAGDALSRTTEHTVNPPRAGEHRTDRDGSTRVLSRGE
jgi:uncharacterized protein YbaA (DUF1428 family)